MSVKHNDPLELARTSSLNQARRRTSYRCRSSALRIIPLIVKGLAMPLGSFPRHSNDPFSKQSSWIPVLEFQIHSVEWKCQGADENDTQVGIHSALGACPRRNLKARRRRIGSRSPSLAEVRIFDFPGVILDRRSSSCLTRTSSSASHVFFLASRTPSLYPFSLFLHVFLEELFRDRTPAESAFFEADCC